MEKVTLEFTTRYGPYQPGDVATFPAYAAAIIIGNNGAKLWQEPKARPTMNDRKANKIVKK